MTDATLTARAVDIGTAMKEAADKHAVACPTEEHPSRKLMVAVAEDLLEQGVIRPGPEA